MELVQVKVLAAGKYLEYVTKASGKARYYQIGDVFTTERLYGYRVVQEGLCEYVHEGEEPPAEAEVKEEEVAQTQEFEDLEVDISSAALDLAEQHGVDWHFIKGTGRDGKVTIADVRETIARAA